MAQRGREGMAKRARERAREERQEAKRLRRQAAEDSEPQDSQDEAKLMEQFRVLSERHADGNLTDADYEKERHRIFVDLGIETDEFD